MVLIISVVRCPGVFLAYSCCRSYVHLDWPSMSSKNFNRLRVLSTEVFNYCTVGTRCGYFPPAASSLIFDPIAAWSCFSTAVIFSCSLSTSTCLQVSIVIWAPGWVDVLFN